MPHPISTNPVVLRAVPFELAEVSAVGALQVGNLYFVVEARTRVEPRDLCGVGCGIGANEPAFVAPDHSVMDAVGQPARGEVPGVERLRRQRRWKQLGGVAFGPTDRASSRFERGRCIHDLNHRRVPRVG